MPDFSEPAPDWKAYCKFIADLIPTKNRLTKKAADTFRKCEKPGQSEEFGRLADFLSPHTKHHDVRSFA